jgi:hypothetical protein
MRPDLWSRAQAVYRRVAGVHQARFLSVLRVPALTSAEFLAPDHLKKMARVISRQSRQALARQ